MPIGAPIAGANIISYNVKFNGLEASKLETEILSRVLCTTKPTLVPMVKSTRVNPELLTKIVNGMFKKRTVRGEAILVKTTAFSGSVAPLQVKVLGSNSKEFKLQVKAKGSKPIVVRLDRDITQNVEFVTEKAGLVSTPLRIETLTIDKKGKVKGTLKVDCSKKASTEVFMSEHSGPHPDCRK